MPELLEKIKEVILLCLDLENDIPPISKSKFIDIQQRPPTGDKMRPVEGFCFANKRDYSKLLII